MFIGLLAVLEEASHYRIPDVTPCSLVDTVLTNISDKSAAPFFRVTPGIFFTLRLFQLFDIL
jgi:hypothetical protein